MINSPKKKEGKVKWYYGIALITLLGFFTGCAATKQARKVETSGFLGDIYDKMRKGKKGEALLVYRNPKVQQPDFVKSYKKILLDPVTVWRGEESKKKGVSQTEFQLIADTFYSLIHQELSKDYEMVDKPGPNTLRAQVAITKAKESHVGLDVISGILVSGC